MTTKEIIEKAREKASQTSKSARHFHKNFRDSGHRVSVLTTEVTNEEAREINSAFVDDKVLEAPITRWDWQKKRNPITIGFR
jgi:hypothetical protein